MLQIKYSISYLLYRITFILQFDYENCDPLGMFLNTHSLQAYH